MAPLMMHTLILLFLTFVPIRHKPNRKFTFSGMPVKWVFL